MVNLTDQERDKFATWLLQEAKVNDDLIEQMDKLSVPDALIKHKKMEVVAMALVAGILGNTEVQSIGG